MKSDRRARLQTSPEILPVHDTTTRNLDDAALYEMGYSKLFTYSKKDRKRRADIDAHMNTLLAKSKIHVENKSTLQTRNEYLTFLAEVRQSEYYRSLKSKFFLREKLMPDEYFYFALTTDDVNLLDIETLVTMCEYYEVEEFMPNIDILIALRRWQDSPSKNHKLSTNLLQAISKRARADNMVFLNLHNANFSAADLDSAKLNYADLAGADLTSAHLYSAEFICSCLDNADLSYANCVSKDNTANRGFHIKASLARRVRIDKVDAQYIDWGMSDFTDASFKDSFIGEGRFENAKFDNASFRGTTLHVGNNHQGTFSINNAFLVNTKFINFDFTKIDISCAQLLDNTAFAKNSHLSKCLYSLNERRLDPIKESEAHDSVKKQQINALQVAIAKNVIAKIETSNHNDEDKIGLFNTAIEHDIFQPEDFLHRFANGAERSIFAIGTTFFGDDDQYRPAYTTKAIELLQAARDRLLPEESSSLSNSH